LQKDGKEAKSMRDALTFHLTYMYNLRHHTPKLLHNAAIISILLTFASSIQYRAPRDLISLWD